jgi:hypothetical protein
VAAEGEVLPNPVVVGVRIGAGASLGAAMTAVEVEVADPESLAIAVAVAKAASREPSANPASLAGRATKTGRRALLPTPGRLWALRRAIWESLGPS